MKDIILDKSIPIPLYYQLKEIIKEKIESGELKPGDILPSERELANIYQISRPTVRQALKELVNVGLLYREKGKGTFVSKPKINYGFIQKLTTFYDDMKEKGYVTKTKVVNIEVINARLSVTKKLNLSEKEQIIYISRIRSINGEIVVTVENYIPYKLCPELIHEDLTDKSLYRLLSNKFGLDAHKAKVTLEPSVATEHDSEVLNIEIGAPIHLMKNLTYNSDGIIIDYFESRFRGDKGKVTVELYN
ncbi:MAG: GntR family transcriptional regulator [Firmicutes bacterium]|nr:GntR family transcriptional regulator [Bacillota bacterium]